MLARQQHSRRAQAVATVVVDRLIGLYILFVVAAVAIVAVGLFYREGYFRQMLDASGTQLEIYAVNSRESLPVRLVADAEGTPLRVAIELPGRDLRVRVWRANVGRVPLYLLDSDDPLNSPFDRGITAKLYGGDGEARLLQEIVLGVGGWRAVRALGLDVDVCHLNEGHAALATVERARTFAEACPSSPSSFCTPARLEVPLGPAFPGMGWRICRT